MLSIQGQPDVFNLHRLTLSASSNRRFSPPANAPSMVYSGASSETQRGFKLKEHTVTSAFQIKKINQNLKPGVISSRGRACTSALYKTHRYTQVYICTHRYTIHIQSACTSAPHHGDPVDDDELQDAPVVVAQALSNQVQIESDIMLFQYEMLKPGGSFKPGSACTPHSVRCVRGLL